MKKILYLLLCVLIVGCHSTSRDTFEMTLSDDGAAVLYGYLPHHPSGRAVVCCPGGGYAGLALGHEGKDWSRFFNERGIAFFVLQYRMPGGDRTRPMEDALKALETVRSHAEAWHVNPNDVGIMGSSAGGHLAAVTSVLSDISVRPAFQILFYPVISMNMWGSHEGSCMNFLGEDVLNPEVIAAYSAEMQIKRHTTPPAIIFASVDDTVVPVACNGMAYANALLNAEIDTNIHLYPDGGHGWGFGTDFAYHGEILRTLGDWLDKLPSVHKGARKVACIGDSITDGHRVFAGFRKGYPATLERLLGPDYQVENFGVGARTLLSEGDRPYRQEQAWAECKAFNPDIVVIALGTNDAKAINWAHKENFARDYQALIDELKALPCQPEILLCTPPMAFKNSFGIQEKIIEEEIVPMIKSVAAQNGFPVIDLYNRLSDPALFQGDGIHPNYDGDACLAEIVAKAILENA